MNYFYSVKPEVLCGTEVRGFLENGRKECYESALHKASCFIKKDSDQFE